MPPAAASEPGDPLRQMRPTPAASFGSWARHAGARPSTPWAKVCRAGTQSVSNARPGGRNETAQMGVDLVDRRANVGTGGPCTAVGNSGEACMKLVVDLASGRS